MVNEFLYYNMCRHQIVHIEPGESAIHSGRLIDLARHAVKVFGINVLLDVELYRPHGELFGHLFTDVRLATILFLCQAAGAPAFDVGKHIIPVALSLGHDRAFGAKFRWIL